MQIVGLVARRSITRRCLKNRIDYAYNAIQYPDDGDVGPLPLYAFRTCRRGLCRNKAN